MNDVPPWYYDPKLYLSIASLVVSFFALWRVEVRNKEIRKQELLDRAEHAYWRLEELLQLAMAEPRVSLTAKDVVMTTMGAEHLEYVEPELPEWPYLHPLLPAGRIATILNETAEHVLAVYDEAKGNREAHQIPPKVPVKSAKNAYESLDLLKMAILEARGTW